MSYRVELPVFSGPLDLLLHLVKQQEVDIHEISISRILEQYLRHLDVLRTLDLGDLGEFAVMASTLMEIKSRELLPPEEVSLDEDLDPRDDLIQRLLQYKRYRDISRRLERLCRRRARMVEAGVAVPFALAEPEADTLDLEDVEIWTLTEAFARLLAETGGETTLRVDVDRRDVRFYTERILARVKGRSEVPFEELFAPEEGRAGLIGAFVAILEMMKQGYLRARQEGVLGPVFVEFLGPDWLTADHLTLAVDELVDPEGAEGPDEHGNAQTEGIPDPLAARGGPVREASTLETDGLPRVVVERGRLRREDGPGRG